MVITKESTRIFKAQHWKIVLLIAVFGFAEMIGAYVLQLMVMGITTSFLAIVVCHVFFKYDFSASVLLDTGIIYSEMERRVKFVDNRKRQLFGF
ncbi:hypothetical protein FK545_03915 [Planococcus glaciei]|nr:hypothetical protein [Planococcus glaciei]QDY44958.1 hypothetical protein FK545_03915 [Planococcus glaciei]